MGEEEKMGRVTRRSGEEEVTQNKKWGGEWKWRGEWRGDGGSGGKRRGKEKGE